MSPQLPASISPALMQDRIAMYRRLRDFFTDRQVQEVETSILSQHGTTDPQIESFSCTDRDQRYFLHTSPEFTMKRLLSTGFGDIFQICKVFRREEIGRRHHIEFTMLEWYRLGFSLEQLMHEVADLVAELLKKL